MHAYLEQRRRGRLAQVHDRPAGPVPAPRGEQAADPALETALVLLGQLRRDEALALLMERANVIATHERRLSRLLGDLKVRGGAAYIGQSHTVHRLRSERRFLSDTIALLQDSKWEPEWILDDGPIVDSSRTM